MDDLGTYFELLAERLQHHADTYTNDPVLWIRSNNEDVWSAQQEVLESIRDNRYTAVHSGHDLGKSFVASRAIAWWVAC
ncbi:MAG: hypothetical protein ACRDQA_05350, partial [Nocardioidaceae bacterium]